MRKKNLFILLMVVLLGCKTAKDPAHITYRQPSNEKKSDLEKINKIDSLVQKLVKDKKTAGISYAIALGENEPVFKSYGIADLEESRAVTPADQFRIASITKLITATAILKLVEMNKVSLDHTIDKFFPAYPNGNKITIYHLLSHTSGVPNWWDGGLPEECPKEFPMCQHPSKYLQEMKNSLLFEPGTFYSYSNTGYVLLGEIITIASGIPYDGFVKTYVFDPANMVDTEMEYIENVSKKWVKGYAYDSSKTIPFVEPEVYHMPYSAGGLRSNTKDMLMFINALSQGKIIKKEWFDKMTSYAKLNNGKPTYEGYFKPRKPKEHLTDFGSGLGFEIMNLYEERVISHSGGIAGFNAVLMHIPKNNGTFIFMANTEDGIVPALNDIRKIAVLTAKQE